MATMGVATAHESGGHVSGHGRLPLGCAAGPGFAPADDASGALLAAGRRSRDSAGKGSRDATGRCRRRGEAASRVAAPAGTAGRRASATIMEESWRLQAAGRAVAITALKRLSGLSVNLRGSWASALLDTVAFRVVYVLEAVVLGLALSCFFCCCGCQI